MNCAKCGAHIPGGMMYCPHCGQEVQMVPDYNPLDEVLAEEVRGSLHDEYMNDSYSDFSDTQHSRARTGQALSGTNKKNQTSELARRKKQKQAEQRRAKKKRQRRILIIGMILSLIIIGAIVFLAYRSSYNGLVKRGNTAYSNKNYTEALDLYNKAVTKDPEKADAYKGIGNVYIAQKEEDKGEEILLNAVKKYPNVPIYKATIDFYIATEQMSKISELLDDCDSDEIKAELKEYQSAEPEFSLKGGSFDDVQEVTLSSTGKTIYYTTDGSEPTTSSTKYSSAIQISEGTTIVRAISVNEKGVPSLEAKEEYIVELPIEDAPAVNPSSGQYDEATEITVKVPDGYTAYYTTDKSIPTTSSKKYTGPIQMEEGDSFFYAILVNANDKASDVTKRHYVLDLGSE